MSEQTSLQTIVRARPVAEQVRELLQERILEGTYPAEQRMPSEQRLAQELAVSRATVRSALAALAESGLVRRVHGDGTYPMPNTMEIAVHAQQAWNIERQILRSGRKPSSRLLSQGRRTAQAEEAAALGLPPGSQVYAIRRVFLADERVVMLAHYALRLDGLREGFPEQALEGSLLEFMAQFHSGRMQGGQVRFKAIAAAAEAAERLQVSAGSPLLLLEALVLDENERPLLAAWEYYPGDEGFHLPLAPMR